MIWIAFFFIIILISSVLAYRSMKDYEEFPDDLSLNALYFISSPQNLNSDLLRKLHQEFAPEKKFFSIEKLVKGTESALVVYAPREISSRYPELGLVELEDYLDNDSSFFSKEDFEKKVNVNQVLSWLLEPKSKSKRLPASSYEFGDFVVENTQKVFLQTVLMPVESPEGQFQTTLRIMVADLDPVKRVELAKSINQQVISQTDLTKRSDNFPESKKFESFKQRSLIPREVEEFLTDEEAILKILS